MAADPPATLPDLLRRNREAHGSKRAIVTDDGALTHADLDADSRSLASRLVAAGIGKASHVGLLAPNGIEWAVAAAAVMRVGATLVPLSTLLRPPELAEQLQVADVSHLVAARRFRGRSYLDEIEGIVAEVPSLRAVWALDDLPTTAVGEEVVVALEAAVRPADDLVVLFTSGSRGTPKGVVHTHGGALAAVAAGLGARCVGPDDRLYIPMPFFWTGGFAAGLLSALVAAATLVTEAVPEPEASLALLERERVTIFRGWPDQAAQLAAHPRFAEVDLASLGPGSLPAVLPPGRRPAPGARPNLFGMTETCGPYCGDRLDVDLPEGKQGSCGRPFPGYEVRIVDPATGTPCPAGEVGEIRLRGRNVLRAICGRTREETFDAEGWYPTGDLGSLDADGYLWFRGRADDMFKVKGATVFPSEVEAAIRSVPGVAQAHVTDLPADDGSRRVAALVVTNLPLDEVVAATRARLSSFKVPTAWSLTATADDVPLTPTSKVDKPALQALLKEGIRT